MAFCVIFLMNYEHGNVCRRGLNGFVLMWA